MITPLPPPMKTKAGLTRSQRAGRSSSAAATGRAASQASNRQGRTRNRKFFILFLSREDDFDRLGVRLDHGALELLVRL